MPGPDLMQPLAILHPSLVHFGRFGQETTSFNASSKVQPSISFFFGFTLNPLYQSMFSVLVVKLSPCHPDIGMNGIFLVLKPILVSILATSDLISLYRPCL